MPPWADAIVLRAMAKSPNDRYQSAAEMQADIQRAASGMQVAAMEFDATRTDHGNSTPTNIGGSALVTYIRNDTEGKTDRGRRGRHRKQP